MSQEINWLEQDKIIAFDFVNEFLSEKDPEEMVDTELPIVKTAINKIVEYEFWDQVKHLWNINQQLNLRGYQEECELAAQVGIKASRALNRKDEESRWLGNRGIALTARYEYDQAAQSLNDALEIAQQLEEIELEAKWLGELGRIDVARSKYAEALIFFQKAREALIATNDEKELPKLLGRISSVYVQQGDFQSAFNLLQEAIALAVSSGDERTEAWRIDGLGRLYSHQGDAQEASKMHKMALEKIKPTNDRVGEAVFLGNLAIAERKLGNLDEAILNNKKALEIYDSIDDKRGKSSCLGNLGVIYDGQQQREKAIKSFIKAIDISRTIGDRYGEGNYLSNLGNTYASLSNFQKAIQTLEIALKIAKEIGYKEGEGHRLGNLGNVYLQMGEPKEAIEYFSKAKYIFDQLNLKHLAKQTDHNIQVATQDLKFFQSISYLSLEQQATKINNQGFRSAQAGKYELALRYLQKALSIQCMMNDLQGELEILTNIGGVCLADHNYDRAARCYKDALSIVKLQQPNSLKEGELQGSLGHVFEQMKAYSEAEKHYYNARQIFISLNHTAMVREIDSRLAKISDLSETIAQNEEPNDDPPVDTQYETMERIGNEGISLANMGQSQKAKLCLQQALSLAEELDDKDNKAKWLDYYGRVLIQIGDYEKAIHCLTEAQSIYGRSHELQNISIITKFLGIGYFKKGDYVLAIETFNNALEALHLGEQNDLEEADILCNLGHAYANREQFIEAKKYYLQALNIFEILNEKELIREVYILLEQIKADDHVVMVEEYLKLNNYELAIQHGEAALVIYQQINNTSREAKTLNLLAEANERRGNIEIAKEFCAKALTASHKSGDRFEESITLQRFGQLEFTEKHYDEALNYSQRSIKSARLVDAPRIEFFSLALAGNVYEEIEDYDSALDYYRQALEVAVDLKDEQKKATLFSNIGFVYATKGEFSIAIENFEQARTIYKWYGSSGATKMTVHMFFMRILKFFSRLFNT